MAYWGYFGIYLGIESYQEATKLTILQENQDYLKKKINPKAAIEGFNIPNQSEATL